jgi:hypothetical protein
MVVGKKLQNLILYFYKIGRKNIIYIYEIFENILNILFNTIFIDLDYLDISK